MNQLLSRNRNVLFILVAIAFLPAVGGCGDDDSNADSPSNDESADIALEANSLSKKEFAQQAAKICTSARAKFDREFGAFRKSEEGRSLMSEKNVDKGEAEEMMDTIFIPTYQEMADELVALGAPSTEVKDMTAFIESVEVTLELAAEDPLATYESGSPFLAAGNLGTKAGVRECSFALT